MSGKSVLSGLTAEIMGEKKKANGAKLTPVEGERATTNAAPVLSPPSWPTDLPGAFMSHEGMRDAAKDLRRHAAEMLKIADALDAYTSMPSVESENPKAAAQSEQRQREREADEAHRARQAAAEAPELVDIPDEEAVEKVKEIAAEEKANFNADFEAKQKAAQEAVYGSSEPIHLSKPEPSPNWRCPKHGRSVLKETARGRQYLGCPECGQFAR